MSRGQDRPAAGGDAPLLADLMPWSTGPLRLGRSWVMAPDAGALRARWELLTAAPDEAARTALFGPTRLRTPHSAVPQLPGHPAGSGRIRDECGRCPEPVAVLHGAYDRQWLLPDHRLIDVARPELWRVADDRQLFVVEPAASAGQRDDGPAVVVSALLPDGRSPAGRPGRVRPLYRRPGGTEPNCAPGLLEWLAERLGRPAGAAELAQWIAVAAVPGPDGIRVPLPGSAAVWQEGVALGREVIDAQTGGARSGVRPKLPGGQRPYVRAALPARPDALSYDAGGQTLAVGTGRVSPVPPAAWDFQVAGVRVLEAWFEARTAPAAPGTLAAVGPAGWPPEWTSQLLELVTVLALLDRLRPARRRLADRLAHGDGVGAESLRAAGVLPVPAAARRPASVLDHHEEGPDGQFTLV